MRLKLQSSLEFFLTYSFVFIIIGLVISVLFLFSNIPKATLPTSCNSYSGPVCNFVLYYTNATTKTSLLTLAMQNSQSVPLSINSITATINNITSTGRCAPSLVSSGGTSTCIVPISGSTDQGQLVHGIYTVNAGFCNSGLYSLLKKNCTLFENVSYGGAFSASASLVKTLVFSGLSATSPTSEQQMPYQVTPGLSSEVVLMQNGDWVNDQKGFSYGSGSFVGTMSLGLKTGAFPDILSNLQNQHVACASPFNSVVSVAYTPIYVPAVTTINVRIRTEDAMEVYNKSADSFVWGNVFKNAAWKKQSPTTYPSSGSTPVSLSKGISDIAVVWTDECGAGIQTLNMTGLSG